MSSQYLNEADSSDDENTAGKNDKKIENENVFMTEGTIMEVKDLVLQHKTSGNDHFSAGQYEDALKCYNNALNLLKSINQPKDTVILLNRSATYLALKRYVPALNDANQASELEPSNWKSHWRKGVALMSMSKRKFRTEQALQAFKLCLACGTLPDNKVKEVEAEIVKVNKRLEIQDAETPPADLSNCAPS